MRLDVTSLKARIMASKRSKLIAGAVALAVVGVIALVAVPVGFGSTPGFYSSYKGLSQSYETLQASNHSGLACTECHTDPRGGATYEMKVVGDFYAGLVSKQSTPRFVQFDKPKNGACLKCHLTDWSTEETRTAKVPHPAHMSVASETRECVKCHKWTAHDEVYMEKHKTMPFSGVCAAYGCHVGTKTDKECSSCHHSLRETKVAWKVEHPAIVNEIGPNACLEKCHEADQCRQCHTTGKTPEFKGLATETGLKQIEVMHVQSTWIAKHGREALKDQSKCMKCHVSEGECNDCHAERPAFHGSTSTWIGQHKKLAEDKKEWDERRCLACHEKPWCEDCHDQFKEMR